MPASPIQLVDVYPYRRSGRGWQYLLLRRAPGHTYSGSWRMVGGKIGRGERAWRGALRELDEETGFRPHVLWALPSVNTFYEWQTDRVLHIPAFGAEVEGDPVLDDEHDAFGWYELEEATRRLRWPEQRRLVRLMARLLAEGLEPAWLVRPGHTPRVQGLEGTDSRR